jgi:hypothetical protein
VRFKNFSKGVITVPWRVWVPPRPLEGHITESIGFDPGEITGEFDENDPVVQLLLKAHPELRPVVIATSWQRVLDDVL